MGADPVSGWVLITLTLVGVGFLGGRYCRDARLDQMWEDGYDLGRRHQAAGAPYQLHDHG